MVTQKNNPTLIPLLTLIEPRATWIGSDFTSDTGVGPGYTPLSIPSNVYTIGTNGLLDTRRNRITG